MLMVVRFRGFHLAIPQEHNQTIRTLCDYRGIICLGALGPSPLGDIFRGGGEGTPPSFYLVPRCFFELNAFYVLARLL